MHRDMITQLALIAHPKPQPGHTNPPELFDDARQESAERRDEYAENLRDAVDATDHDPLLAALRNAAAQRDKAQRHVRALLTYAREFTGDRPDYTWETLAAAAGLPYSTARRAVTASDLDYVRTVLGR